MPAIAFADKLRLWHVDVLGDLQCVASLFGARCDDNLLSHCHRPPAGVADRHAVAMIGPVLLAVLDGDGDAGPGGAVAYPTSETLPVSVVISGIPKAGVAPGRRFADLG